MCKNGKQSKMSATNKRFVRSNKEQIQHLCTYMTMHPEFAAGDYRSPLGARQNEEEWVRLKAALDEIGPQRSVEQWKVCWRDQKRKARLEGGARSRAVHTTGNSSEVPDLSNNMVLVLSAIGTEMAVGIGPDESPIGFNVEELMIPAAAAPVAPTAAAPVATPAPVSLAEPAPAEEPAAMEGSPRAPQPRPARRRVRRSLSSELFLNAQLELNGLIRELIAEVRESNELRREQLDILQKRQA